MMSGAQRYSRAISAEVGEIERRLRALERNLERAGGAASANVKARAEILGRRGRIHTLRLGRPLS